MSHIISIDSTYSKEERYLQLLSQIKAIVAGETDLIANLANITSILKETFSWWWVGFYFVKENELVLGPFQGPLACTRIAFGKGVCGSAWSRKQTIMVDDVETFEGHIACSSASRSEMVIPIMRNHEVLDVLDIDSEKLAQFDVIDQQYLEELTALIALLF
ncbi:MAG: GAF domain-containing protein [Bacteroidetes bacterium]|nr:GAF domain-containing protein [Bacteroidota bacterium]